MNSEYPPPSGYSRTEHPLIKILELTRDHWDHPGVHPDVRDNFRKVLLCRTPALGGEVYACAAGEKVFYHTCKSKCCPSCGYRATLLWLREQWVMLPDIPFVGITLTMPDLFWPVFKAHRHLQHDLPALGAAVLQQWAWTRYRVRLCVIVVQHTFGGRLNYNPHLHIMVSAGGLKPAPGGLNPAIACWVESLKFDPVEIKGLWRVAVCSYLRSAHRDGLLRQSSLPEQFNDLIHRQLQRNWIIHITRNMPKERFLRYAGRYIRRLPISRKRILQVSEQEVVYQVKDTRTKTWVEVRCPPAELVALLSQHVLDRYRHSMRYFGLADIAVETDPRQPCLLCSASSSATPAPETALGCLDQKALWRGPAPRRLRQSDALGRPSAACPMTQKGREHWARLGLEDTAAAVDDEIVTSHIAGGIGAEEEDRSLVLVLVGHAAHGD